MAVEVIMPRLTHDMSHGIIVKWLKEEGEVVTGGEPIFEVETDKAISEVVAENSGILRGMRYKEGDEVPIGTVIALILAEDESLPADWVNGIVWREPQVGSLAPTEIERTKNTHPSENRKTPPILASPIAKRIAGEHHIDLRHVKGSGPGGRIVEEDVLKVLPEKPSAEPALKVSADEIPYIKVPLTRIQRTTGKRLLRSVQSIPHFVLEKDVDMTEAQSWKEQHERVYGQSVSYTAFLLKIIAHALSRYPMLNASFYDDHIRQYKEINVGIAIANYGELIVPVIRRVDTYNALEIQHKLDDLRRQVEEGLIKAENLSGGTFTLSNLGMYGIDRFQAIINPPEVAILAVGKIHESPWVKADRIEIRPIMNMRLSIDHRALDGSTAAPFLIEVGNLIENPPDHILEA